jgi:hypothetical protein
VPHQKLTRIPAKVLVGISISILEPVDLKRYIDIIE